jgi:hypothetical protein
MGMVGGGGEQQHPEGALQRHVMALIVGHLRENNLNQVTTPLCLFVSFSFFLSFSHVLLLHTALLLNTSVSFTVFFVFTSGILLLLLFLFPCALLLRVLE